MNSSLGVLAEVYRREGALTRYREFLNQVSPILSPLIKIFSDRTVIKADLEHVRELTSLAANLALYSILDRQSLFVELDLKETSLEELDLIAVPYVNRWVIRGGTSALKLIRVAPDCRGVIVTSIEIDHIVGAGLQEIIYPHAGEIFVVDGEEGELGALTKKNFNRLLEGGKFTEYYHSGDLQLEPVTGFAHLTRRIL